MSWRIENDVLVTDNGLAFLAGGNQQPLKFATGELTPSAESISNFCENVGHRAEHAAAKGINYAHVIFPDKQSILLDEFPIQPIHRLGDTYLSHLPGDTARRVAYPVDALRVEEDACMPLDTHLSDIGSLVALQRMLQLVGVDAPDAIDEIRRCITRVRRWPGDLGSKLDPPLLQEVLFLEPSWEVTELSSGGGFNDGMIDIVFSPSAPINQTVLLFGDSFFRMMLKHLSGVFTRVVCLRTRFYHPEMVELIEPDVIFSGNAERYLGHVDSDNEAIPFMLYRPIRGIAEQFEPPFLKAWRSVTSPRSKLSAEYFGRQRVEKEVHERNSGHLGGSADSLSPLARPLPSVPEPSRAKDCYDAAPYLSVKHTTYFPVYDRLFSPYVSTAPTLVEVGVLNGGSLLMWREFFGADARIIGVDLNPDAEWLRDEGFEIHIGDQSDPQFWFDFFAEVGPVDVFLDDGGHTYPQQIVTASAALDHIRDGGLLVIEDTHTSYMPEFGGPSDTSFVSWAMNLVHGLNHRFSAFAPDHTPERRVWSIEFFESIVAFRIDRRLGALESRPTKNDGLSRNAKDFRHHSDRSVSDAALRSYFRH